jgi:hypothetical protein
MFLRLLLTKVERRAFLTVDTMNYIILNNLEMYDTPMFPFGFVVFDRLCSLDLGARMCLIASRLRMIGMSKF